MFNWILYTYRPQTSGFLPTEPLHPQQVLIDDVRSVPLLQASQSMPSHIGKFVERVWSSSIQGEFAASCKEAAVLHFRHAFVGPCGVIHSKTQVLFTYDFKIVESVSQKEFCKFHYFQTFVQKNVSIPGIQGSAIASVLSESPVLRVLQGNSIASEDSVFKLMPILFIWGNAFPHVMKDILPRLVLAEEFLLQNSDVVLLLIETESIRRVLHLFKFPLSRVMFVPTSSDGLVPLYTNQANSIYYADHIYVPLCFPGPHTTGHFEHLYELVRQRILRELEQVSNDESNLILWISRAGASNKARSITNEQEVIKKLQESFGDNLKYFAGTAVAFKDELTLFHKAKLVIGPHGGAFYNILACSPGTVVLELTPDDYGRDEINKLAVPLSLRHISYVKSGMKNTDNFGDINVEWLFRIVSELSVDKRAIVNHLTAPNGWKIFHH